MTSSFREHHELVMKDLRHRAQLFEEVCERNREHRLQIFRTETEQMKKIIQMKVADGKAQQELAQTYREEQEALRENITALRARMDGRIQHSGDHETEQSPGDSFCERDQLSSEIAEAETQLEVRLHDYLQKSALYRERSAEFSSELARVKSSILELHSESNSHSTELGTTSSDLVRKNEDIMNALEKERDEYKTELFHAKKKLELQSESETENETETANTPNSTPDTTPDDFVALTPDMIRHQSAYEILWTCYPSETEQQRAVEEFHTVMWFPTIIASLFTGYIGIFQHAQLGLMLASLMYFRLLNYQGWKILHFVSTFLFQCSLPKIAVIMSAYQKTHGKDSAICLWILMLSLSFLVRTFGCNIIIHLSQMKYSLFNQKSNYLCTTILYL